MLMFVCPYAYAASVNQALRTNILLSECQVAKCKAYLKILSYTRVYIDPHHLIMSKRMRDHLPYLQVVAKCKPKVRKLIIDHGRAELIISICESVFTQSTKRCHFTGTTKSKVNIVAVQETSPYLSRH